VELSFWIGVMANLLVPFRAALNEDMSIPARLFGRFTSFAELMGRAPFSD
jgi:hypothetical protein